MSGHEPHVSVSLYLSVALFLAQVRSDFVRDFRVAFNCHVDGHSVAERATMGQDKPAYSSRGEEEPSG